MWSGEKIKSEGFREKGRASTFCQEPGMDTLLLASNTSERFTVQELHRYDFICALSYCH